MLIRQGWEASLSDVGLSKFVRVALALHPFPKQTIPDWGKTRPSHNNNKSMVVILLRFIFDSMVFSLNNLFSTKIKKIKLGSIFLVY